MTEPNAPRAELLAELETMHPAPSVEVLRAYVDEFTAPDEYDDQSGAVAHWMNVAASLLTRAAAEIRALEQKIVDLTLELSRLQVRPIVERERKGEDVADLMSLPLKRYSMDLHRDVTGQWIIPREATAGIWVRASDVDALTAELAALREDRKAQQKAAQTVIAMLELGDNRLLASDGPAGGQLPDLSPDEWGKVYRACKVIAKPQAVSAKAAEGRLWITRGEGGVVEHVSQPVWEYWAGRGGGGMSYKPDAVVLNARIDVRRDTLSVELDYPRNSQLSKVEVGMCEVRAADSILIEYDFVRDGWSIKQASTFSWDADDKVCDPDWQEVAFVEAWARERRADD